MNDMDFIKMFSEFVKNSMDNNPNYSEWEKWWRKSGVEETEKYARYKCSIGGFPEIFHTVSGKSERGFI
ncbi:MAG: hypothetical protein NC417_07390 [Candidatus Gastranaerophilales bacterium]|nr:hypothetical protein [Candidatus Gastranaerophilales bacterium]